eukprot:scaffold8871_cov69-Skeletonema_marinoi.AAC.2
MTIWAALVCCMPEDILDESAEKMIPASERDRHYVPTSNTACHGYNIAMWLWLAAVLAVHTCQKHFSENGVPYVLACYERECDKGDLTTVKLKIKTDALHLDIPFCSNYLRMMQTKSGSVVIAIATIIIISLRRTSLQISSRSRRWNCLGDR